MTASAWRPNIRASGRFRTGGVSTRIMAYLPPRRCANRSPSLGPDSRLALAPAPAGSTARFGISVSRTIGAARPARISLKPSLLSILKMLCTCGFRVSPSTNKTRRFVSAIAMARLQHPRKEPESEIQGQYRFVGIFRRVRRVDHLDVARLHGRQDVCFFGLLKHGLV